MVLALAVACGVSSCGGPTAVDHTAGSNSSQAAQHNADDVAFAVNMRPHHQQAVELSAMVPSRTTNPDLLVVAKHISMDQQAEIRTFNGLLARWGNPVAPRGGMTMSGMVDTSTMIKLRSLRGTAFDELWMTSMIAHHQGAITMAQAELARGQSPDARHIAEMIVTAQKREISRMKDLLGVTK